MRIVIRLALVLVVLLVVALGALAVLLPRIVQSDAVRTRIAEPLGMDPLDALCDSAARIRELVASGDEAGFVELMHKGRDYLATRT